MRDKGVPPYGFLDLSKKLDEVYFTGFFCAERGLYGLGFSNERGRFRTGLFRPDRAAEARPQSSEITRAVWALAIDLEARSWALI